jgi:hypothetical protein
MAATGWLVVDRWVGFERPAVAPVRVAVGIERGKNTVRRAFTQQEMQPTPLQNTPVGRDEGHRRIQVHRHAHILLTNGLSSFRRRVLAE